MGEKITIFDPATQMRVSSVMQGLIAKGYDAVTATTQAYKTIKDAMSNNAYAMAFSDSFYIVAWLLVVGAIIIWFCQQPKPGASTEAG